MIILEDKLIQREEKNTRLFALSTMKIRMIAFREGSSLP